MSWEVSSIIMKIGPVCRSAQVLAAAVECSVFFKRAGEYLRFQLHEAPVTFVASNGEMWVTAGEDKSVYVLSLDWEEGEVKTLKRYTAGKKVIGGVLSGNTALFGDKHGEVWRADLGDFAQPPVFSMGHQAPLVGMWLGSDLLTFDKEFKIKVSSFPLTYDLKQVLLGHCHNITSAVQHSSTVYSSDGSGKVIKWDDLSVEVTASLGSPVVLLAHPVHLVAVTCENVYLLNYDDLTMLKEVVCEHEGVVKLLGDDLVIVKTNGQELELHTLVI